MFRRSILAAVLLAGTAIASPASAVDFTLSDGHGAGPFGEVTGFFTSATSYDLHFNMNPNFIIDTGGHFSMAISLNTGTIAATATTFAGLGLPGSPWTIQPHIVAGSGPPPGDYKSAPFQFFSDAVAGNCPNTPGNGGCGGDLWISVTGVNVNAVGGLFNPATDQFNGFDVFAAVDIYQKSDGKTFVVGLGSPPIVGPQCATPPCDVAVPGPIVGAGIPGLIAALGGMWGLNRFRRRRTT